MSDPARQAETPHKRLPERTGGQIAICLAQHLALLERRDFVAPERCVRAQ
jgi:hypothetical protein